MTGPERFRETERCAKCKQVKSFADFRPAPRMLSGHRSLCRDCENARAREQRAAARASRTGLGPRWVARFWAKVDRSEEDGCWPWTAMKVKDGYGLFRLNGRMQVAHRIAYELLVGPIPEGLQIDHLCRRRECVKPAHLEPVTQRENALRGVSFSAQNALKTSCPQGHPYDEANTWLDHGRRRCKVCKRARWRAWNAARKRVS